MKRFTWVFLALVVLPTVAKANLIVNGGFETGSFSGWTLSGNTGDTSVQVDPYNNTGSFGAKLAPKGSTGSLFQAIATEAGKSYQFNFSLLNFGGRPNSFDALWNGVSVQLPFPMIDAGSEEYTLYTFNVTATGNLTVVDFDFRHDVSSWGLDDVSVTATPVPAGVILTGVGAIWIGGFSMIRRKAIKLT